MRDIPDPGFAGDDGTADAALVAALAGYDADPHAEPDGGHAAVLAVLQHARLLVPVVAVLGEVEHEVLPDGREVARDKSSDMATVLLQGRDGRTALLAFTSTAAMQRWDRAARPVPVTAATAAQAALQDGAAAVVVDVAGPVRFVVSDDDLRELAAGHLLVRAAVPQDPAREVDAPDPAHRARMDSRSDLSSSVTARYVWVTPDR